MPERRRLLSTAKRCPRSGWKGCVISAHPHCSLDCGAVDDGRRNADGAPLLARALRHVDSSHGRRLVAAGLHALEEIAEVLIEMLRVLLGRLSVDPGGTVLARAPVRLAQPVDVDVVSQ